MDKYKVLKEVFGHSDFREGQEQIVDAILSGRDIMGIMPTGAGKSVCYQLPALMLDGITIVISPLISLMKDQVMSLVQLGIKAAYINSSLTASQYREVFRRANNGAYKIIYVAPERLMTSEFLSLCENSKVSMVTVDEAHCVSQWGQDFRPSYLKIAEFTAALSYRPIVSAFTATATAEVRDDIIKLLRLNDPFTLTTGFDRKNLHFSVIRPKSKYTALKAILDENKDKSCIVYCLARKTVEEVCEKLRADGFTATRYHAGLSEKERHQNQDDFIFDRCSVMVATNAFGMGIDKSDVGLVVHYNMPKNMESYYQEAGRAGRDGSDAACVLLYSGQDVRVNRYLIENGSDINEELTAEERALVLEKDIERLKQMTFYCTTNKCLREFMLKYFGEKAESFCGNCSNCNTGFDSVDVTELAQRIIECIIRLNDRNLHFGKAMICDILHGSKNDRIARMRLDNMILYASCASSSTSKIRTVCDYLTENGYLDVMSEYSTLAVNEKTEEITNTTEPLIIKMPKEPEYQTYSKTADIDNELLAELKALRLSYAKKIRVPAYVIFNDATLKDMCRKLPKSYNELLKVAGVGAVKAKKYGDAFCRLIIAFTERNN